MASIATLAVDVVANTRQFARQMGKATGIVTKFGETVQGIGKSILNFRTMLAGLAGGALFMGLKKLLNWATDLSRVADDLGTTRRGILNLRGMGRQVGIEAGQITNALQTMEGIAMQFTPGTFRMPDPTTMRALGQIGLSGGAFAAIQDPAEQLMTLINQINQEPNRLVRRALATDLGISPEMLRLGQAGPVDVGDVEAKLEEMRIAEEKVRAEWEKLRAWAVGQLPKIMELIMQALKTVTDWLQRAEKYFIGEEGDPTHYNWWTGGFALELNPFVGRPVDPRLQGVPMQGDRMNTNEKQGQGG